MGNRVNYHIHTNYSDGRKNISDVLFELKENNVSSFAITDHDKVLAAEYLVENPVDIQNYSGAELTAYFDRDIYPFPSDFSVHILAYDFDVEVIKNYLRQWSERRKLALKKYAYALAQKGTILENIESRTKMAREMHAKQIVDSFMDGVHLINKETDHAVCVPIVSEVFRAIKEAGGVIIWAHPFDMLDYNVKTALCIADVKKILSEFIKNNITGIEAEYLPYPEEDRLALSKLAEENNLVCSAGTDYHAREGDALFTQELSGENSLSKYFATRQKQSKIFLAGGRSTKNVYKEGAFVYRPLKNNDGLSIPFLNFLSAKSFPHSPRYIETVHGQNKFEYIPGFVPDDIGRTTTDQLLSFMRIVRALHDISTEYTGDNKVICHNDLSPCNTVFRGDIPIAIIDWDSVSKRERWHDLTYVLWLWTNIGSSIRDTSLILSQMKAAMEVYGADQKTRGNFATKLIWRMDKAAADAGPENLRIYNWVDDSKTWVSENKSQIDKIIG